MSKTPNPDKTKRVVLNTLKLGQLREEGTQIDNERLEIRWSRGGQERREFDDMFEEGGGLMQRVVTGRFLCNSSRQKYDPILMVYCKTSNILVSHSK